MMAQCNKCCSSASCERPWKGMEGYLNCVSFDPVMTNADSIRGMSDEDLADFLSGIEQDAFCASTYLKDGTYIDSWDDWLKQEADK